VSVTIAFQDVILSILMLVAVYILCSDINQINPQQFDFWE